GPAAHRPADARPGALLLPDWVHGPARGNGDRGDGAAADLFLRVRGAVPAPEADGVRAHARAEARRARLGRVAREHGLGWGGGRGRGPGGGRGGGGGPAAG